MLELNLNPDERTLRRFGLIALCVFTALGLCAWRQAWPLAFDLGRARAVVAIALWLVAASAGLFAWIAPRANRALYATLTVLGYPIGVLVSHAVLAVMFFAIFVPVSAILRVLGKDALQRTLERDRPSYWSAARGRRPKSSYFRQF